MLLLKLPVKTLPRIELAVSLAAVLIVVSLPAVLVLRYAPGPAWLVWCLVPMAGLGFLAALDTVFWLWAGIRFDMYVYSSNRGHLVHVLHSGKAHIIGPGQELVIRPGTAGAEIFAGAGEKKPL